MNGESGAGSVSIRVSSTLKIQEEGGVNDLRDRQHPQAMGQMMSEEHDRGVESGGMSLQLETGIEEQQESVISKQGTRNLLHHLDPFVAVDTEVQNMIGIMMDDFVQRITEFACTLTKHRNGDTVQKEDILFAAQRLFGISDDPSLENLNDLINPSKLQQDFSDESRI